VVLAIVMEAVPAVVAATTAAVLLVATPKLWPAFSVRSNHKFYAHRKNTRVRTVEGLQNSKN
jgi:hypothetical protein